MKRVAASIILLLILSCASQDIEMNQTQESPLDGVLEQAPIENRSNATKIEQILTEEKTKNAKENEANKEGSSRPFFEPAWEKRINAAMAPYPCLDIQKPNYPASYYQGPLTDTHLHIPALPDWKEDEDDEFKKDAPEGRFGGPQAILGWNIKIAKIACTIKNEGTQKNFAFFPVYEDNPKELIEVWNRTMTAYPNEFMPFIMSSGNDDEPDGFPTVDAKTLNQMLSIYPKLFKGYGEIGLYERENGGSPELPPNAQRLQEIYPLVRQHKLVVYFHPGDGQRDSFEQVLMQYPDITFIVHGDQFERFITDLMDKYPNIYYGIDSFWGGDHDFFLMFVGKSKEDYLQQADRNFDEIVDYAIREWKTSIEKHPDRFMWGIDRGDAVWNYDLDVGQMQVKIARAFIGKLDPRVQERFAYKNAEALIAR